MRTAHVSLAVVLAVCALLFVGTARAQVDLTLTPDRSTFATSADSQATVTVQLHNEGTVEATNVTIGHHAPLGLEVNAGQASAGRYEGGTWSIGRVSSGQRDTLALAVQLRRPTPRILTIRLHRAIPADPTGAIARVRITPVPTQRSIP